MLIIDKNIIITCKLFSMVNIHAKNNVFSFTANSPNNQVRPNNGNKMMDALSILLYNEQIINKLLSMRYWISYRAICLVFPFCSVDWRVCCLLLVLHMRTKANIKNTILICIIKKNKTSLLDILTNYDNENHWSYKGPNNSIFQWKPAAIIIDNVIICIRSVVRSYYNNSPSSFLLNYKHLLLTNN